MRVLTQPSRKYLTIIGCANGAGGRHPGSEEAATVMRNSKILRRAQIPMKWENTVQELTDRRQLHALPDIALYSKQLALVTKRVIEKRKDLVVIGGDHSCAIGTWSGVSVGLAPQGRLGLIWVDAHMDAHTPMSSASGNVHGMPVAHLLGHGDQRLSGIFDKVPKILPQNLVIIGARSYEPEEEAFLQEMKVRVFYMDEVKKRGVTPILQDAIRLANEGTAGFGFSIDLDGFRPEDAPAVGTPEQDGIVAREFLSSLPRLDLRRLLCTEIAEFLPARDTDRKSERLVVELIRQIYKIECPSYACTSVNQHCGQNFVVYRARV